MDARVVNLTKQSDLYSDAMVPTLDIVIPVLNESKTLETQLLTLEGFLKGQSGLKFGYRITIADNGSTDSTRDIANEIASRFEYIRVVCVEKRGVGLALKSAWESSKCDYVGYMDLDFSTNLRHLIDVERAFLNDYECAFGSRMLPESVVIGRSLKRNITSKVFNMVIRSALHSSLTDGMCGFKFLRRDLVKDVFQMGADCDGWFFCTELAVAAQLSGHRILEIPVTWQDDAESKVRIPSLALEYVREIWKFRKRIQNTSSIRTHK